MIENGTLLQDRYLIEKQIGAGGMGAVYLAVDRRFDSYVAIKETFYKDEELGAAFEREARLLNGLNHSSLPHVSDYFTENNNYFLVMQYIEGEDLSGILKRDGAFPAEKVLNWTDRLLDALEFLHSQNPPVIHRDIKPQNLKITPHGDVILLDFGLAKLKTEDASSVHSVFGYSRKYSPLEQIQGTGTDARSDIFSLAATAYHLLTGQPPIDVLARASEIVAGRADPLQFANEINNEIPVGFAAILDSALALNADERFASAEAMRRALKHNAEIENSAAIPLVVPQNAAINSTDGGNFPALEAFAAGNENDLPVSVVIQKSPAPNENFEYQTRVVPHKKRSNLPIAALVVLLLCAVLATGYYAFRRQNISETDQTPIVQKTPETNESVADSAELSPDQNAVNAAEIADVKESVSEPTTAKSKNPITKNSVKINPALPNPTAPTPRRREPAQSGVTRERIVEEEPIIEEEPIVEEEPQPTREERIRRRQERLNRQNEFSEEEFQELRRERRRERRQRQNRNQFPPF